MPTRLHIPRSPAPMVPGQPPPTGPAADEPERGPCQCGHRTTTGPRWCGLDHHGLGCHENDSALTRMPRRPGEADQVAVCSRCAARAGWWRTRPANRAPTEHAPLMGRIIILADGSRCPVGQKPPYVK